MSDPHYQYRPFRKRLRAFARELARLEDGDLDALHRTRVASRRLREMLPLLQFDAEAARKFNRRLRRVTKQLGAVRQLDVLAVLIDEFRRNKTYSATALNSISTAVTAARAEAREHLATNLPLRKLMRLVNRLDRAMKGFEHDDRKSGRPPTNHPARAWLWALEARVARRADLLRSTIQAGGVLYAPEPLHDVRVALKKFRYAAELAHEVKLRRATADIRVLRTVQDVLGRLNDLESFLDFSRRIQADLSPSDRTTWRALESLRRSVERDSRYWHARYLRHRAKLIAIASRFSAKRHHQALNLQRGTMSAPSRLARL